MKNWIAAIVMGLLALPGLAQASEGGANLRHMKVDYSKEALSAGAKTFINNCTGCHSAKFYRLKGLVDDLGMSKDTIEKKLMYGTKDVNAHLTSAMTSQEGGKWFGAAPPDLSVDARARGSDWLYSYLLGFYRDDSSSTGWNNHVFPKVSMPNVLYHMTQNSPEYYSSVPQPKHGKGEVEYPEVPKKLDTKVQNLVSFLTYMSDPSVLTRHAMGPWVLLFLVILGVLTYLVKKEYWRDIH
ncbi:MAG TPA: cytochrome c1 [Gammaproteobacteria bacterium]|nr:cytochrome c1 [Gammaproteobacteria bacterium]